MQQIKYLVLSVLMLSTLLVQAQEKTSRKKEKKGKYFIAFNLIGLTSVGENSNFVIGGKGGFYLGKRVFLGGRAAGIALNERYFPEVEAPEFGYIGPMVGVHLWRKERLQASLLGATGLGIVDYTIDRRSIRDRTLFIMPSAEVEYFFSKNVAVGMELGYRRVSRTSLPFTAKQLSGLEFGISLKLGRRPL